MTGTAIAVSDGTYMPKMCTQLAMASWHIENPLTTLGCHGLAQVSGTKAETNAYLVELQGIHTILMALKAICDFHLIQHGSITIHCDNKKGIYLSSHTWLQPSICIKHVDLIRAIHKLATSLLIKVTFAHIYGHQDNDNTYAQLDQPSKINVDMDSAAKQHLRNLIHLPDLPPCPAVMSHEGWQCWVADTKMTSDPADAIHHHIFSLSLHNHLAKEKPGWPPKLLSALFIMWTGWPMVKMVHYEAFTKYDEAFNTYRLI